MGSVLAALGGIVMLILAGARAWKACAPRRPGDVSGRAAEVLGRCRVEPRQSIYLIRVGPRILVLGSNGSELTALSEITDSVEVDLVAAQCRDQTDAPMPFARLFATRQTEMTTTTRPHEAQAGVAARQAPRPMPLSEAEARLEGRFQAPVKEHGRAF